MGSALGELQVLDAHRLRGLGGEQLGELAVAILGGLGHGMTGAAVLFFRTAQKITLI